MGKSIISAQVYYFSSQLSRFLLARVSEVNKASALEATIAFTCASSRFRFVSGGSRAADTARVVVRVTTINSFCYAHVCVTLPSNVLPVFSKNRFVHEKSADFEVFS